MHDSHSLKFKEKLPEETIKQIKEFFTLIDIKTEEEWLKENEIGTYSLRLSLKEAPGIGANGKGTTRAYARASAYAEFMERLQNMRMSPVSMIVRIQERHKAKFVFHPSEKYLTAEELVEDNNAFIQNFFKRRNLQNASAQDKISAMIKVQRYDFRVLKEYNQFLCVPFFSVREDRICYVPYFISSCFYASNGMCAGNTTSEALVQGISEVLERNSNNRVLTELTSLPDIPEYKLAHYPEVHRMYQIIKGNEKYNMQIKDASYGGIFPVVGLVLIEKNTGKFGVKFGAHPDIGLALERIFTEATQGVTLEVFSHKSELSFLNELVGKENNLINSFRTSNAQYPYQMLMKPAEYQYYDFPMVNHYTNDEILRAEINKLLTHGYDVMINDCSYTGFGSYQVIIPGLSEVGTNDDDSLNRTLERFNMQYALGHPSCINENVCRLLINHLIEAAGNVLENTLYYFTGVYSNYSYPGKEEITDVFYLIVVCALRIKEYSLASEVSHFMTKRVKEMGKEVNTDYIMLEKYADGMLTLKNHDKVIEYMRYIFDDKLCDEYDDKFAEPESIIQNIYSEVWIDSEYCSEFRKYEEIIMKFKDYQERHPVDLSNIQRTIKSLLIR